MAAPSTLEEITLFVLAGKADERRPLRDKLVGAVSAHAAALWGGFWFSVKCQYFLRKEVHLFGLFLTERNSDVCGVLLDYPYCMGKNRTKPAL